MILNMSSGSHGFHVSLVNEGYEFIHGGPAGQYYSRGFTLSGRPDGLSNNPAVVPGYVQ